MTSDEIEELYAFALQRNLTPHRLNEVLAEKNIDIRACSLRQAKDAVQREFNRRKWMRLNTLTDVLNALPDVSRAAAQDVIDAHVERLTQQRASALRAAALDAVPVAWAQINQTRDMTAAARLREIERVIEEA